MSSVSAAAKRGPYRNGTRRREQIIETASEVFGQFGYVGGSIRTIAERVGVSPATLLQHFGSKEGLLMAVLEDWTQRSEEPRLRLDLTGLAYFQSMRDLMRFHLEHRGLLELFLTMTAEASNVTHPAASFIRRRYVTVLESWGAHLREARELGEVADLSDAQIRDEVRTLIAVADGLELQWLLDPSVDLPGLFGHYLEHAIDRWKSGAPIAADPTPVRITQP